MGAGSGSGSHNDYGGGGDLMTEQMHTLLEMLRAAKADDMAALEEAESRALQTKDHMRRLERERKHNGDAHHRRGGSGNGHGRPAMQGADESVQIARAEKEAARRQQRFEARQREYVAQQQQQQYDGQYDDQEEKEKDRHEV